MRDELHEPLLGVAPVAAPVAAPAAAPAPAPAAAPAAALAPPPVPERMVDIVREHVEVFVDSLDSGDCKMACLNGVGCGAVGGAIGAAAAGPVGGGIGFAVGCSSMCCFTFFDNSLSRVRDRVNARREARLADLGTTAQRVAVMEDVGIPADVARLIESMNQPVVRP